MLRFSYPKEAAEADYKRMFATNVDSAYFLCKDLQQMLAHEGGGVVVNVASAAGLASSGTGAIYGMTKGAIISLTKILCCEWAKHNIRYDTRNISALQICQNRPRLTLF